MRKRIVLSMLVAGAMLLVPGCKNARVGARCSAAEGSARNATHVLLCVNGRWKAALTIGQAADFITSTWPATLTVAGSPNAVGYAGFGAPTRSFIVRDRTGRGINGATVTMTSPAAGPGRAGFQQTTVEATTNGLGLVEFRSVPLAGAVGEFDSVVSTPTPGGVLSATIHTTVRPNLAASAVIISGDDQVVDAGVRPDPIVVEFRDRYGNPVEMPGAVPYDPNNDLVGATITQSGARVSIQPAMLTYPGDHAAGVYAGNSVWENGEPLEPGVEFSWEVVAGPPARFTPWGDGQAAMTLSKFIDVQVQIVDQFGNPTEAPGAVTWSVVPGPNGATGTLAPYVSTDLYYRSEVTAGAIRGTFTVHVDVEGLGSHDFEFQVY